MSYDVGVQVSPGAQQSLSRTRRPWGKCYMLEDFSLSWIEGSKDLAEGHTAIACHEFGAKNHSQAFTALGKREDRLMKPRSYASAIASAVLVSAVIIGLSGIHWEQEETAAAIVAAIIAATTLVFVAMTAWWNHRIARQPQPQRATANSRGGRKVSARSSAKPALAEKPGKAASRKSTTKAAGASTAKAVRGASSAKRTKKTQPRKAAKPAAGAFKK